MSLVEAFKATMLIEKVEPTGTLGVFNIVLKEMEGSSILLEAELELPKQILVLKKGDRVLVEVAKSPISWREEADLYLSAKVFGTKPLEEGLKLYASSGGLQVGFKLKEASHIFKPLEKLYVALKTIDQHTTL